MERSKQLEILVNEKKQAQCPSCGDWVKLELDSDGLLHEFTHCHRNIRVAIDEENLEKLSKGRKKIKKQPDDWWVYKNK